MILRHPSSTALAARPPLGALGTLEAARAAPASASDMGAAYGNGPMAGGVGRTYVSTYLMLEYGIHNLTKVVTYYVTYGYLIPVVTYVT